ncbi:MAG: nitrilase-related carbon-nitrogen hydrolase [Bacillota bacterium]|nr:nitrilase-related carbon-nitrogen hydrolase [Bacillota bacterium]
MADTIIVKLDGSISFSSFYHKIKIDYFIIGEIELNDKNQNARVAVVQAPLVIMDCEANTEKAVTMIIQAAEKGANVVVFPEIFIPGGLSFGISLSSRKMKERNDGLRFRGNSVSVPGNTIKRIGEAAKKAGIYLVVGVNDSEDESSGVTPQSSLLFFGPDGSLRKVPKDEDLFFQNNYIG